MTDEAPLVIDAVVDPCERPLLIAASQQLSECLGAATGRPYPVRLGFRARLDDLAARDGLDVVIASMRPELDRSTTIEAVDAYWREALGTVLRATTRVLVCTIFRGAADRELIERIRRLNLLAIGLSNDLGVGVADIDRLCAHVGVRELQTDHDLRGTIAAQVGGYAIVASVLGQLDDAIAPDVLERARAFQGNVWDLGSLVRRRLQVAS